MSISDAELKAKFTEAFKTDDNFIDELECAENGSQMKEVLLRKGIDVTEEEAESFLTQIKMHKTSTDLDISIDCTFRTGHVASWCSIVA